MKTKVRFAASLLVILILTAVLPQSLFAMNGGECGYPTLEISKPEKWNRKNVLRGHGIMPKLKEATLFATYFNYNNRCAELNLDNFRLLGVEISIETNIPFLQLENTALVFDENSNFRPDPEEPRFPFEFSPGKFTAQGLDILLPFGVKKTFLVIADLNGVKEDDEISLRLDSDGVFLEPVETQAKFYAYTAANLNITHIRNNRPPRLFFSSQKPYGGKYTVYPTIGSPQEEYTFSVLYKDEDGDAPARAEVWIDLNLDGEWGEGERFPMRDSNPDLPYIVSHQFTLLKNFTDLKLDSLRFKFHFADQDVEAVMGEPKGYEELDPGLVFELWFEQNVVVKFGRQEHATHLPGEIFPIKVQALVHFQGAIDLDWKKFSEEFRPDPFIFKGISVGGRGFFNDIYDIEEATLFLGVPAIGAEKLSIKFPQLSFTGKVEGRSGRILVPDLKIIISDAPRLEGPFVNQTAVKVGEPIVYRFRSVRPGFVARPDEYDRLTFRPFVEVKREMRIIRADEVLIIEEFVITLMLFEPMGVYSTPEIDLFYGKLVSVPVEVVPGFNEKFAGEFSVPYREKNLRLIPSVFMPGFGWMLFAVGSLVFFLLLLRPARRGAAYLYRIYLSRPKRAKLNDLHQKMRSVLAVARRESSCDNVLEFYYALREYLAVVCFPVQSEVMRGLDSRGVRERLKLEMHPEFLDLFVRLEDFLLTGKPPDDDISEILAKIDRATVLPYYQFY